MKTPFTWKDDFPVFAVPLIFHGADILFAIAGGFTEVLWLVLLASVVHCALLGLVWMLSKSRGASQRTQEFYVGP
ncbi:MAG TPA: hypothetical protein PLQ66_14105 [Anaerolineae bacterium]|nr:hypothetical protein [Anaerolineae bacterium]